MTKHSFTRLTLACIVALAALAALTTASGKAPAASVPADNSSERISIRPVLNLMAAGAVQPAAGSQLTRDKDAIFRDPNH